MMWFKVYELDEINQLFALNMTGLLGIRALAIHPESLVVEMPVTDKVKQPYGLLHGGASVVLAESAGSIASYMAIDPEKWQAVGLEINANHIRPVTKGHVLGTCRALHIGKTTHVWDIQIHNERKQLVCVARLTTAIIKKISH